MSLTEDNLVDHEVKKRKRSDSVDTCPGTPEVTSRIECRCEESLVDITEDALYDMLIKYEDEKTRRIEEKIWEEEKDIVCNCKPLEELEDFDISNGIRRLREERLSREDPETSSREIVCCTHGV